MENNNEMKLRLEVVRDEIEALSFLINESEKEEACCSISTKIDDILSLLNKDVVNSLKNKNDEEYLNLEIEILETFKESLNNSKSIK